MPCEPERASANADVAGGPVMIEPVSVFNSLLTEKFTGNLEIPAVLARQRL